MKFEPLTDAFIPSALRLSRQAGWNQTEEDWKRLCRLTEGGVGIWVDGGEVRASYSVIAYPPGVAWIGMILVDETYRGGGLGKKAFEAALQRCHDLKCAKIGLDATHLGEPIYRKYQFDVVCGISRWRGRLKGPRDAAKPFCGKALPDALLALDQQATGVDRRALLDDLFRSPESSLLLAQDGESYGVLRKGDKAVHLGPIVARSKECVAEIVAMAANVTGDAEVICDVLDETGIDAILLEAGLSANRSLKRMTFPAAFRDLTHPEVFAAAGFELG